MKRFASQRGEITTLLTIASLIFVAAGALLGNQLTQNQALNSNAANKLVCPKGPGNLEGPDTGKDCSGAAGKKVNCGMRVIADTFDVKEIVDATTGKITLVVRGNVCYTGNQTTGAHKDKLYITSEHPGKEACYKVLNPNVKTYNFSPGDIPLCDQSGQWAKLNPRLPIPERFKDNKNGINSFMFTIEKPINGCIYLNTTNSGQQGGGGAGTNFDIWQDPRLCSPGGTVAPSPSPTNDPNFTPTPTCGSGQTCPTNTPTSTPVPSALKCNDRCYGANECGKDSNGNDLVCHPTELDAKGVRMYQCRQQSNLNDSTCGSPVVTPTCRKPGDPTPTAGQPGDPTPTGPVIICPPSATPTSIPTSTPILTSQPTVTPRTDLICDDVCTIGGLSCPSEHICTDTGSVMKCRRESNPTNPRCELPAGSPTPTASPTPKGGACEFWPVNFLFVRHADGSETRVLSPDKNIYGTLNNKMLDEIKAVGKDEKEFLRAFNNSGEQQPKGFDSFGETNPCKTQNGGVAKACTIPTTSTNFCCGYPKDELNPIKGGSGAPFEIRNYDVVNGENAKVKLFFDDSRYEIVKQCFNDDEHASVDDNKTSNCRDVTSLSESERAIFDDSRLKVMCGLAYRYGWVIQEKTSGPKCVLSGAGCQVSNVKADIKTDNRATVSWDYPSNCPELKEKVDRLWIDIVDENEKIVCTTSQFADKADLGKDCKLGRDVERGVARSITEWESDMDYHANVWTVQASDNSCRVGARSNDFSKPGDDPEPGDDKSHQLDIWETNGIRGGSQGDDCFIAADTKNGTNAKQDTHCKSGRKPNSNGLDLLYVEYTNNKSENTDRRDLKVKYQINTCEGRLLDPSNPVCEDWIDDKFVERDLKWGETVRCEWVAPFGKNNVTCNTVSGGGNGGSGGSGGGNNEDDSVPAPTVKPDSKNIINVDLQIEGVAGWGNYWEDVYKSVSVTCAGGVDTNLCGKVIGIGSYIDSGKKYSFNAVEGVTYYLVGLVGFKPAKTGETKKLVSPVLRVEANGDTQDVILRVRAPILPTATGSITNTPPRIPGEIIASCDVDGDNSCTTRDYIQVSQRMGLKGANLSWDLNQDNTVNSVDVSMVLFRLGASL